MLFFVFFSLYFTFKLLFFLPYFLQMHLSLLALPVVRKAFSDVKFSPALIVWLLIFNVFYFPPPHLPLVFSFSMGLISLAAGIVSIISSCSQKYCQSSRLCFTPEEKLVDRGYATSFLSFKGQIAIWCETFLLCKISLYFSLIINLVFVL